MSGLLLGARAATRLSRANSGGRGRASRGGRRRATPRRCRRRPGRPAGCAAAAGWCARRRRGTGGPVRRGARGSADRDLPQLAGQVPKRAGRPSPGGGELDGPAQPGAGGREPTQRAAAPSVSSRSNAAACRCAHLERPLRAGRPRSRRRRPGKGGTRGWSRGSSESGGGRSVHRRTLDSPVRSRRGPAAESGRREAVRARGRCAGRCRRAGRGRRGHGRGAATVQLGAGRRPVMRTAPRRSISRAGPGSASIVVTSGETAGGDVVEPAAGVERRCWGIAGRPVCGAGGAGRPGRCGAAAVSRLSRTCSLDAGARGAGAARPARRSRLPELAAAGHGGADQLRQPDHGAGVRLAFGLVGVQDASRAGRRRGRRRASRRGWRRRAGRRPCPGR